MNTKFTFALLMIVATIVTACAPAIVDASAPIAPAAPAEDQQFSLLPVTGSSVSTRARDAEAPRLWSGEIFLSDNGNPDYVQKAQSAAGQKPQNACMSEDSLPRRQSGCLE